jgi:alpha-D-xyloside xylohydrolase
MQLAPYLRGAFARYREDGTPPFRALVMDAPNEPALRTVDDQYMVGDRMMVAPLFAGEESRKVVLPAGSWHNFWTGEKLEGGTTLIVQAAEKEIPVYVKSGSLMPWADVGLHSAAPEARQLTVRVYGDGARAWQLSDGADAFKLSWSAGAGRVEGMSHYTIRAWKQMG